MSDDHLLIRFKQTPSKKLAVDLSGSLQSMQNALQRAFGVLPAQIARTAVNNDGETVIEARVPFRHRQGHKDLPEVFLYERLSWQIALLYFDAMTFDIMSITKDGQTYQAASLLQGNQHETMLDWVRLNEAAGGIFTKDWLLKLSKEEFLSAHAILERVEAVLAEIEPLQAKRNADVSPGKKNADVLCGEVLKKLAPGILDGYHARTLGVGLDSIVDELKSFRKFYRKLNERNVAAPEMELSEVVQALAAKYDPDSPGATMGPGVFKMVLDEVPFDDEHGQWQRYGMFLATQLAVEISNGKGGTAHIADLHAELAEEFGGRVKRHQGFHL